MEPKTQQNGARAKILRALDGADCGLTTAELANLSTLTADQVRDNAGAAKKANLLTIEQDEMTRFVTYHITQKGREWLKSGKDDDEQAVADTGQEGEDHQAHYAPEDRGETATAPTGVWPTFPAYSAYMVQGSVVEDIETATAMALCSDDEVIVYGLVEVGRTETRTVFVPA